MFEDDNFDPITVMRHSMGDFISAIPNVVGAIVLIIVGWILAKVVSRFLYKILRRSGIDNLTARLNEIDFLARSKMKFLPSKIISQLFYYIVLLFFLIAATDVLEMPAVSNLVTSIIEYLPNLITAIIVLIAGVIFSDFLRRILDSTLRSLGVAAHKMISNIFFWFLLINVAVSALGQAKVNTEFISANLSILLAGLALAFGLGYGLAARDTFANFLTYFYSKGKVKVGDEITILGTRGKVISLDKTSLIMETTEGDFIVPLHKLNEEEIFIHNK